MKDTSEFQCRRLSHLRFWYFVDIFITKAQCTFIEYFELRVRIGQNNYELVMNLTGEWKVDSDSRQKSVSDEITNTFFKKMRAGGIR